jgi:hypothetical protein
MKELAIEQHNKLIDTIDFYNDNQEYHTLEIVGWTKVEMVVGLVCYHQEKHYKYHTF